MKLLIIIISYVIGFYIHIKAYNETMEVVAQ